MTDIKIDSMAIGDRIVSEHTGIRHVTTRISDTELEVEQLRSSDGVPLLKIRSVIHGDTHTLVYFDRGFWVATLDGQPFNGPLPLSQIAALEAEPTQRTLKLESK